MVRPGEGGSVDDSGSDEDALVIGDQPPACEDYKPMDCSRTPAEALQLKMLQGVFFIAESDSKARLQFATSQDINFFSEGCKQRWRSQLAAALAHADSKDDPEPTGRQKGMIVVPSKAEDATGVRKGILKAMEKKSAKGAST